MISSLDNEPVSGPILKTTVSLSFWGGIDPITGIIIDQHHPLVGQCVADTIFCLPSGRGSCTASQVLLELILNGKAPKAILLRDADGLVAVGALIAEEVFGRSTTVVCLQAQGFARLWETDTTHAAVGNNGKVYLGSNQTLALERARQNNDTCTVSNIGEQFSQEEERLLSNTTNEAERMAMRVIFRYARILMDTPRYTSVTKAHIDGCTYIGPGGLAFVRRLVELGGHVTVPTTLNSMSTDRQRWQALGVPKEYAQNSIALGDAYLELGCQPSFTCAPYLLSNPPRKGEDLVWGESNAVVFANSALGARTEKYADYLDICGAIAGFVPQLGAHLSENRIPGIVLDAEDLFQSVLPLEEFNSGNLDLDALFPILGHLCGTLADGKVPILIGLESWTDAITIDHLKAFCAAYGTTGTSPLIHIAGITPEAKDRDEVCNWIEKCGTSRVLVTMQGLIDTHSILDKSESDYSSSVDLIALGNPHLSVSECQHLAKLVKEVDRPKDDNVRIIGCISREILSTADQQGWIRPLQDFGVEFISDTCWCMLLDPPVIPSNVQGVILTNSAKYAHYGPGLTNRRFRFAGTRDCIQAATTASIPRQQANGGSRALWLSSSNSIQRRSFSVLRSFRAVFHK